MGGTMAGRRARNRVKAPIVTKEESPKKPAATEHQNQKRGKGK